MEVIYYMRNYYPLTAAQKMHHNWIVDYGTQQVSGVSVVASVQAELYSLNAPFPSEYIFLIIQNPVQPVQTPQH